MRNVLVTSAGTRVAYAICKSLAKRGIRVYAGDSLPMPMTRFSRHCAGSFRYASPFVAEERFWDDLTAFIRKKSIDVLIPILEETYCLARDRARIGAETRVLLPDYAAILAVHDKAGLARLARELRIPTPLSHEAAEVSHRPELLESVRFPALLKPKQGGGGWSMRRLPDRESALAALRARDFAAERFLIQEELGGEVLCVCALYHNGTFIAGDAYRTLRAYPWPYGQATARVSAPGGQALEYLRVLLEGLAWNGVCEADFLVEAGSGRLFLLDVNPRFWGSLAQNIAAGVDYPYYYYLLALEERAPLVEGCVPGVQTAWLGGELMRSFMELRRGSKKMGVFAAALRSMREAPRQNAAAVYDDWDRRDPLPFLVWALGRGIGRLLGRRPDALPGVWQ